ncbi:hypothetical protein NDU88_010852, partial [Pleurodeles waltl]
ICLGVLVSICHAVQIPQCQLSASALECWSHGVIERHLSYSADFLISASALECWFHGVIERHLSYSADFLISAFAMQCGFLAGISIWHAVCFAWRDLTASGMQCRFHDLIYQHLP